MTDLKIYNRNLWIQEFEFVSPMPIEECVRRLEARNPLRRNFVAGMNDLYIAVRPRRKSGYKFRLHQDRAKKSVLSRGTLTRCEDDSTLVTGKSEIIFVVIAVIIAVCLICSITVISSILLEQSLNIGVLLFMMVWLAILASMVKERNRLTKTVFDTLSDQIY